MLKAVVALATISLCYLLYRCLGRSVFARRRGAEEPGHDDLDASSRLVSTVHALVVVWTGATTVLAHSPLDFTQANGLEPTLGALGLCVSVGYFVYDLRVLSEIGFNPLVPILLHHSLCALCMGLIAASVPRAVWYACLLQCTEATVPLQMAIFFLERHGHQDDERRGGPTLAYTAARWGLLLLWLLVRELLFAYFAFMVWRDWDGLSLAMKALGWGTGVPLAVFNTGGLVSHVLPGWPWWKRSKRS